MAECPFCQDLLGPHDFQPGFGAICPRCGSRISAADLAASAAPSLPMPKSGSLKVPYPPARKTGPGKAGVSAGQRSEEANEPVSFLVPLRHFEGGLLAAFFLGSMALLLASIPALSFLTKPLSALGLATGLGAGVAPALKKQAELRFPLAVCSLSLVVLLFVGSWPAPSVPPPPPLVAIALSQGQRRPIDENDWVDAGTHAVRINDLRVQIMRARVGDVELEVQGKKVLAADKYLVIRVRVSFEGLVFQQVAYEPWADLANSPSKHPPTLADDTKRTYTQKSFAADRKLVGREDKGYLTPGRQVNEVLVFPVPSAKMEYLRLQMPAGAFGEKGDFKFQIPRTMVEFFK